MKKRNQKSQRKKSTAKNPIFNYYQVISKNNKFNFGAFPPDKYGLEMARSWAEKMTEETGEKCVVRKC